MEFDRMVGDVRVVNAGSVGMPFGNPGAYWLLLAPDVQLRSTQYEFANAAERIAATDYPEAKAFAENHILDAPSEEKMLQAFGRVELEND